MNSCGMVVVLATSPHGRDGDAARTLDWASAQGETYIAPKPVGSPPAKAPENVPPPESTNHSPVSST